MAKQKIYYSYKDKTPKAFCEEKFIYSFESTGSPVAYIEQKVWYDLKNYSPIAFEEDDIVYDYLSNTPKYIIAFE